MKSMIGFCRSLVELLSRSQSHFLTACRGYFRDPPVPRCPQCSMGRDDSLHPPMLHPSEWLHGAQLLAACGDTRPRPSPVKESELGFVFAVKTLTFSSIPAQPAFWWLVRKRLVVIYFSKTHLSPGMGNEVAGKKTLLHLGALPEHPRPPTNGVKQHSFAESNPATANLHQLRIQAFVSLKT